jgi:hypothetical protein
VVKHEAGATSDTASSAVTSSTTPGSAATATGDAAWDGVVSAFVLGWHVTQLFHANVPSSARPRQVSVDTLPGIGDLDPLSRARLLVAQVQADLHRVERFNDAGQQLPDPSPIQSLLQADERQQGQLQQAMLQLHQQLLVALTAADFRLGKAYGLGRALVETTLVPDTKDPVTFQRAFSRYRLASIFGWLGDLKSAFPPHATEAVRRSLEAWGAWVQSPTLYRAIDDNRPATDARMGSPTPGTAARGSPPARDLRLRRVLPMSSYARQSPRPQARPVDWASPRDRQSVTRALHRQGELWRAVLSGEKNCLDSLLTDDYLIAADQLLGHIRHLTLRFLRRFWITTTVVSVVLVGAIATALLVHATSTVIAAVITGAGAIGITWKGAASSLGRVLTHAERPLWESELDAAVADALTVIPQERRSADRSADRNSMDHEPEVVTLNSGEFKGLHG